MSNTVTILTPDWSTRRMFPSTPFVKLGQNFRHLADLLRRFGSIPDILELDHLSVSGDVTFGKQVNSRNLVD